MESWRLSFFEIEAKLGKEKLLSIKVVMSFWISHRRQSCTCERSLKALMDQLKSRRSDLSVQWLNDALLLRRHGPQTRSEVATLVGNAGSKRWEPSMWTRKAQHCWSQFFGTRFGVQKKARSDKGSTREVYLGVRRVQRKKLRQLQFSNVSRLVRKHASNQMRSCFGDISKKHYHWKTNKRAIPEHNNNQNNQNNNQNNHDNGHCQSPHATRTTQMHQLANKPNPNTPRLANHSPRAIPNNHAANPIGNTKLELSKPFRTTRRTESAAGQV